MASNRRLQPRSPKGRGKVALAPPNGSYEAYTLNTDHCMRLCAAICGDILETLELLKTDPDSIDQDAVEMIACIGAYAEYAGIIPDASGRKGARHWLPLLFSRLATPDPNPSYDAQHIQ
jgi:hypothetical protein